jgi:hypothetical protein
MIGVVAAAEQQLAEQLLDAAARHPAEAELFHTAHRLAGLSARNADALLPFAERHRLPAPPAAPPAALPADVEDPHVGVLRELRHLHVLATGVVLDWTALGQGAAAARDQELVAVVDAARTQTARTVKWAAGLLKTAAPQALTS